MEIRVIRGYVFYGEVKTPEAVKGAVRAGVEGYSRVIEDDSYSIAVKPEDADGLPDWADDFEGLLVLTSVHNAEFNAEWLVEHGYEKEDLEEYGGVVVLAPINSQTRFLGEM
jgi:hypothetical protein